MFFSRAVPQVFLFTLDLLSPMNFVVTAQELAAYSCFTTQSFWYSLNDLLAQLSARIRSLDVLLYSDFVRAFRSAP